MSDLPPAWVLAAGSDVFDLVTSGSRGWAKYYSDEGDAFIRMGNLDHGTISLDLREVQLVQPPSGAEGERTQLQPNDILISITAELGMVGLVPPNLGKAYINQHVALARPRAHNDPRFLAWYLASENDGKRKLREAQRGATKVGLGLDDIRQVSIPLAPLNEQRRIVAKLDDLFARSRSAREALNAIPPLLDRYRQSVLAAAFRGDLTEAWREQNPNLMAQVNQAQGTRGRNRGLELESARALAELPSQWYWAAASQVAEVRLGRQRSPDKAQGSHMRPYMRAANVTWTGLSLEDVKTMNFEPHEADTFRLKEDDILLSEASGSRKEVGKVARWKNEVPDCCFQNTLIRARPIGINPDFLFYYFMSEAVSGAFGAASRGINLHHLGGETVTNWPVPVPPEEEQREIIRIVESALLGIDRLSNEVGSARTRQDRLDHAVLAKAFRGELVPQDPNDEPASTLLERIKGQQAEATVPKARRGRKPRELAEVTR